jgi:CHAD domain-containing protein
MDEAMSLRLPPDLLDRSAPESSRLLALSYLAQIDAAQRRLGDSTDTEALHDFRVGLRRLRSCVRAYRRPLRGSVTEKMRQQLRRLTQATNVGRDTEVQLDWLRKQTERMDGENTYGFFWLMGRLEGRKLDALNPAIAEVGSEYLKVAARLRRRVGILRIEVGGNLTGKTPTFAEVSGELIGLQVARLRENLGRVRSAHDMEEAHRARIAVKRLRYLLEPIARSNRRARALIPRLKLAQDLLGEHHDMHVISEMITAARAALSESNGAVVPRLHPGLATLERLAEEQAGAAFDQFHLLMRGDLADRVLTRAEEIGKALRSPVQRESEVPSLTQGPAVSEDPGGPIPLGFGRR